jgi:CBS domain containing-hemolysin-like protein
LASRPVIESDALTHSGFTFNMMHLARCRCPHEQPPRARAAGRTSQLRQALLPAVAASALAFTAPSHASLFSGDTLDFVADIMAWVVLVIAPIIAIGVFWMVHILPERIAEQRHHPQAAAIKTLCLLSLFFGGLLWPLAWLWAYSRPVLHKLAYGTDTLPPHGHEPADEPTPAETTATTEVVTQTTTEVITETEVPPPPPSRTRPAKRAMN